MFEQLDAVLTAAVNYEVEVVGTDARVAKLHVMAAVASWWLDRSLKQFPTRARGLDAAHLCLENVFREQGAVLGR